MYCGDGIPIKTRTNVQFRSGDDRQLDILRKDLLSKAHATLASVVSPGSFASNKKKGGGSSSSSTSAPSVCSTRATSELASALAMFQGFNKK